MRAIDKFSPNGWILAENVPLYLLPDDSFKVRYLKEEFGNDVDCGNTSTKTIQALEEGFDDVLIEPFHPILLLSQVRALVRRLPKEISGFCLGETLVDFEEMTIKQKDKVTTITKYEALALRTIFEAPGHTVSYGELHNILNPNRTTNAHNKQLIAEIRQKIELDPASPKILKTIHKYGYQIG